MVAVRATLIAALCLLPIAASAHDTWTDPYIGVRHLHRVEGRVDFHALFVDLRLSEVSIFATDPHDRMVTVDDFAHWYDADIAINTNFFHWDGRSCGMAAGHGTVWPDSYLSGCAMSLGVGPSNRAIAFDSSHVTKGPMPWPWLSDVVTGKPWILRDGLVQFSLRAPRHMSGYHPRTAVGISEDRNMFIILVADGRRKGVPGLNGVDLAKIMESFGAYDAVNLDGGGSTTLYMKNEGGIVNKPSDRRLRRVGHHLGLWIRRPTR